MIQDPESPESTEEVTHSPLGKSSSYKGGPSIGQSSILSSSFIWLEAVFLHFFSLCVCVCVCEPFRFHPRARFSLLLVYVFTERILKANMSLKSVIYTGEA